MSRCAGATRSEIKDDDTCYAGQGCGLIFVQVSARDDAHLFILLLQDAFLLPFTIPVHHLRRSIQKPLLEKRNKSP
ncbi:hypothetical protein TNCV_2518041 [Trichonephila clavipes]|nr:hypothetical protein TNCV_2518041 [Trichonephila clavipes]